MWTFTQHLVVKLNNLLKRSSVLPATWIQHLGRHNVKFSTGMNPDTELNASTLLGKTLADQVAVLRLLFPGVQKMPGYIESAFRSSRTNEVYFFFRNKYMRLYYTPGQPTQIDDKILTDLRWIRDDFPSLKGTEFGAYGVRCSFDTEGNKAYIFCNKICAYIDYANDKILSISTIDRMFPVLENTLFDNCIDSAFRSSRGKEVYLFKDNKYACIDYGSKQLIGTIRNITDGFPVLKGTIFEDRIHACFASHKENQAYLFKGENYVLINFTPGTTNDILVHVVKPIVDGWSSFRDILPINLVPDAPPSRIYISLDESCDELSEFDSDSDKLSDIFETDSYVEKFPREEKPLYLDEFDNFPEQSDRRNK